MPVVIEENHIPRKLIGGGKFFLPGQKINVTRAAATG
jgi:hypothetical protein